MRQTLSRGMVAAAAATGILSLCGSPVHADSHADGTASGSPGVASGNAVQVPVHVPVNLCGNTVNAVALLNQAFGNACTHGSGGQTTTSGPHATGTTTDSPGVASGNTVQAPVNAPINLCGNTVNAAALLNQASGNGCSQGSAEQTTASGSHATGTTTDSPGVASGNTVQVPVNAPINLCGNGVTAVGGLNPVSGNGCAPAAAQPAPLQPATVPPAPAEPPVQGVPAVPAQTPRDSGSGQTGGNVGSGTTQNNAGSGVSQHLPVNDQGARSPQVGTSPQKTPNMPHMPHMPHVGTPAVAPRGMGAHQAPVLAKTGSDGVIAASAVSVAMLTGGLILYRRGRVSSHR
ncbi:chaplin [Streptomyces hygroscopicus]|uniref:chaplin n=1 Tax=Streptomyces hygroscopicus TaxID=1912 RepID=UPI002AD37B20|nr:chaplin [Streptomyces hygroscopicus]